MKSTQALLWSFIILLSNRVFGAPLTAEKPIVTDHRESTPEILNLEKQLKHQAGEDKQYFDNAAKTIPRVDGLDEKSMTQVDEELLNAIKNADDIEKDYAEKHGKDAGTDTHDSLTETEEENEDDQAAEDNGEHAEEDKHQQHDEEEDEQSREQEEDEEKERAGGDSSEEIDNEPTEAEKRDQDEAIHEERLSHLQRDTKAKPLTLPQTQQTSDEVAEEDPEHEAGYEGGDEDEETDNEEEQGPNIDEETASNMKPVSEQEAKLLEELEDKSGPQAVEDLMEQEPSIDEKTAGYMKPVSEEEAKLLEELEEKSGPQAVEDLMEHEPSTDEKTAGYMKPVSEQEAKLLEELENKSGPQAVEDLMELKGDEGAHVVAKKRGYSAPDDMLSYGLRSSGMNSGLALPSRHRELQDPEAPENAMWNKQDKVDSWMIKGLLKGSKRMDNFERSKFLRALDDNIAM